MVYPTPYNPYANRRMNTGMPFRGRMNVRTNGYQHLNRGRGNSFPEHHGLVLIPKKFEVPHSPPPVPPPQPCLPVDARLPVAQTHVGLSVVPMWSQCDEASSSAWLAPPPLAPNLQMQNVASMSLEEKERLMLVLMNDHMVTSFANRDKVKDQTVEMERLKEDIEAKKQESDDLRGQLDAANKNISSLRSELAVEKTHGEDLTGKLAAADEKVLNLEKELEVKKALSERLEGDLTAANNTIEEQENTIQMHENRSQEDKERLEDADKTIGLQRAEILELKKSKQFQQARTRQAELIVKQEEAAKKNADRLNAALNKQAVIDKTEISTLTTSVNEEKAKHSKLWATLKDQYDKLNAKLQKTVLSEKEANIGLEVAKAKITGLEGQVTTLHTEAESLNVQLQEANKKNKRLESKISQLTSKVDLEERKTAKTKSNMDKIMVQLKAVMDDKEPPAEGQDSIELVRAPPSKRRKLSPDGSTES